MPEALPDIKGFLLSDPTVASMVKHGSPLVPWIFPVAFGEVGEAPQLPAITYQVIDMPDEGYTIDDGKATGMRFLRVQIDCWGINYDDCDRLSWAVRNLFNGFSGMMGSVAVGITTRDNMIDSFEPERKQFRRILDFQIVCEET